MKTLRRLFAFALLGAVAVHGAPAPAATPAETKLKVDRSRSYIDVDVKATLHSFTGRLDRYELTVSVDTAGKIKDALLKFKFTDLKTGNGERDGAMIVWLGGGEPGGVFDLGILALAPDGQGQASGKLAFHGETQLVEFPVTVKAQDGVYTVTGKATIDYRHWGLKKFKKFGVTSVDPEVTIRFQIIGALPVTEQE